ncbi:MAG: HAD-IA family hydrolase [Methyloceanibacter sp.]|jgi:phosphoglycolate phosphatase
MKSIQPCEAVIFDLDGTLADTVGDLALAVERTLADFGLPSHHRDVVQGMTGNGLKKLVERAFARHGVTLDAAGHEKAFAHLVDYYSADPLENSKLYPGVWDTLKTLDAAGINCAVLTNKLEPIARNVLQGLGIGDFFKAVHGEKAGSPRKPDPASALGLVETLGARPETTLIVGDSEIDLKTARAAGLRAALVTYGYSSVPVATLKPDAVINDFHELVAGLALASEPD